MSDDCSLRDVMTELVGELHEMGAESFAHDLSAAVEARQHDMIAEIAAELDELKAHEIAELTRSLIAALNEVEAPGAAESETAVPDADWRSSEQRLEDLGNEVRSELGWQRRALVAELKAIRKEIEGANYVTEDRLKRQMWERSQDLHKQWEHRIADEVSAAVKAEQVELRQLISVLSELTQYVATLSQGPSRPEQRWTDIPGNLARALRVLGREWRRR